MFNVVFTDEGRALIAEIASDIDYSLLISDVKFSDHDYTGQEATVTEATFTGDFASGTNTINVVDSTTMRIESSFDNRYINVQKDLYTIGIFAKCVKVNGMIYTEIDSGLLAVCTVSTPRIIPPYADAPFSVFSYNINLAVGSADNVTVVETQAGVQYKELITPLTINGNTESTVEDALDGLNDYSDALKDNLAANENVYGAKNLNSYPYKDTTKSLNGITFTDNGNGTITVNGTASANTVFDMHLYLDNPCIVENGAYILSGCPSGGGISTYNIRAYEKNSGGTDVVIGKDYGDGVTLTLNGDYYDSNSVHLDLAIVVTAGAVISTPITFKPMLRDARVIDPTFAPYAETNLQLTRKTSGLSNENLLDNPWFTVNQRGATTITSGYGADRWNLNGGSSLSFSSSGVTLTAAQMGQVLESVPNITYTLSVKLSNGTIYSGTFNKQDTDAVIIDNADIICGYTALYKNIWFNNTAKTSPLTIRAVKLERGTVSTLANDVEPNYTTELLKCQRYFYRFYIIANTTLLPMANRNTTDAYLTFDLPTELRATPTVTYTGSFQIIEGANIINVSSLTLGMGGKTRVSGSATCAGGLTAGYASMLGGTAGSYIDFSADL